MGSTGSGKSSTVVGILQDVVGITDGANKHIQAQKNSHIVIFDIHAEYRRAFTLEKEQAFTLNVLDVDTLALPYWLMNAEELESLFIESNEQNSYNQVSQFKRAVIANKERHNPSVRDMTYDCPVYLSIDEVYRYIENVNREVIGKLAGEDKPKLANGTPIESREKILLLTNCMNCPVLDGEPQQRRAMAPSTARLNRFSSRLQTDTDRPAKPTSFLRPQGNRTGSPTWNARLWKEIIKQFKGI